jgi:hypothetical protein
MRETSTMSIPREGRIGLGASESGMAASFR